MASLTVNQITSVTGSKGSKATYKSQLKAAELVGYTHDVNILHYLSDPIDVCKKLKLAEVPKDAASNFFKALKAFAKEASTLDEFKELVKPDQLDKLNDYNRDVVSKVYPVEQEKVVKIGKKAPLKVEEDEIDNVDVTDVESDSECASNSHEPIVPVVKDVQEQVAGMTLAKLTKNQKELERMFRLLEERNKMLENIILEMAKNMPNNAGVVELLFKNAMQKYHF